MKISFFITRSIIIISLIFTGCSDDSNELALEDTQHLKILKNNFPDVYNQINVRTYQTHSINVPDKGIVSIEAYEIHNNEAIKSYYIAIDGRKLVTSITDQEIIQKDLETNQQFIVPRIYDRPSKRFIPDFEKAQSGFISNIHSSENLEIDTCETRCWTRYVSCMIRCGVTGITIAMQNSISHGIYDAIAVDVFTGCTLSCESAVDFCITECSSE